MLLFLARWLRIIAGWIDLLLFTLLMLALALLPRILLQKFYPPLFHAWCRVFVRAVNVDLRLHQKNALPLPQQYILIANHPSAFEDVGVLSGEFCCDAARVFRGTKLITNRFEFR